MLTLSNRNRNQIFTNEKLLTFVLSLTAAFVISENSLEAVTQYDSNTIGFVREFKELKTSLKLPTEISVEEIKIPINKLKLRAQKSTKDERIEPVQIYVSQNLNELSALASMIARKGRQKKVEAILLKKLKKHGPTKYRRIRVDLSLPELKYMRPAGIAELMAKKHYNVTINTKKLNRQKEIRSEFLSQLKLFLSQKQRKIIASRFRQNQDLNLEKHLLPHFARKMIRQFLVYRGPNCFHAALSFHDPDLTRSPAVNVKEEPGYHRAMINYDELWRVISRNFYEVNTKKSPLKYGDMLVFFAVGPNQEHQSVNFKWIRHTATYLFGDYTFSKGSKSPNTPYTIKTIEDEWKTWQSYTKTLGVKVYRRIASPIAKVPPVDLTDWIY